MNLLFYEQGDHIPAEMGYCFWYKISELVFIDTWPAINFL